MYRKIVVVLLFLGLLASAGFAGRDALAAERIFLKIGASSLGGSWFPTMAITASVINAKIPGVISTVTTGGAITNVRNIQSGKIQMGFTYTGVSGEAWNGRGAFKKPHRNFRAIGIYMDSVFAITVPAKSSIKTFYDIKGKRTSAGKKGWGSTQAYERMLAAHGLSFEKIRKSGGKVHHVGWSDAVLLMKDRQVDVIQLAQSIPNPLIMQLEASFPVRVLGMKKAVADKLVSNFPGYVAVKIPKGMYKGQIEDAWTVSDNNMLVASSKLPDDLVYKITKAIYETPKPFQKLAWLRKMSWKTATSGVPIPFHRGAARYYKEKGISVRSE
ncbi:MAG: TAXI family TRAP transporter solute-binding subunit [Nitrospinota bacterium]|jgi:TRAP transporter TAXI family solute receptor